MAAEVADGAEEVLFKKRVPKKSARKRAATPPTGRVSGFGLAGADTDEDEDENYSSEDEQGQRQVKRRKKNSGIVTASSANDTTTTAAANSTTDAAADSLVAGNTKYTGDRTAAVQDTNDATRQSHHVQMGAAPQQQQKSSGTVGPSRGTAFASNVRMTNFTDYSPDVCKDYKQTGFCGFGDSCKFLHAREDYKAGWQLDTDWDKFTQGKKKAGPSGAQLQYQHKPQFDRKKVITGNDISNFEKIGGGGGGAKNLGGTDSSGDGDAESGGGLTREELDLLDKVPFKCIICKGDYRNPIVTRCGHYYCEACALQRFRKSPACAACGAGTGGVFNQARHLARLLEKKRKRQEEAEAAGETEAQAQAQAQAQA